MNTLIESQYVTELADVVYDFLPGKPHPYGNRDLSFPGAAITVGVERYWPNSSKRPSLIHLFSHTLDHARAKFCPLIVAIVKRALTYRSKKNPLTRQDIERVNEVVEKIGFKIPELWDQKFLSTFPIQESGTQGTSTIEKESPKKEFLRQQFQELFALEAQKRGIEFEKFLESLFAAYNLAPRGSFSIVGEQIDGSFTLDSEVYLVEAKWHATRIGAQDLLAFAGKINGKARWTRGLFVSYSGFSEEGLTAFQRGQSTNIICLDGLDLHQLLSSDIDFREILRQKIRRAAETSRAFVPVRELLHNVI